MCILFDQVVLVEGLVHWRRSSEVMFDLVTAGYRE